jgi:enoyl-CoA hydratase
MAGPIARIVLIRADHMNAVDARTHSELLAAFHAVRANLDVRVAILQGEGRAFSAGGDFDFILALNADADERRRSLNEGMDLFNAVAGLDVPLIAAVHGHAMGLGATLVALCDIVVAYAGARIADPHVAVGLVAGDGGVFAWTAAVGTQRAKRYLLTGDAIDAREAYRIGLVTDLVETVEEVMPAVDALAQRIAALPPMAVQGTKRIFNALERDRNAAVLPFSMLIEMETMASEDIREAVAAAKEKRPGQYRFR